MVRSRSPFVGLLAFAVAGAMGLRAQDNSDEVYELSPFTVAAEDETGYVATQTLAGTRLKSNLRDLAGAIQIVTPEFLEDTSSTGTEDLFLYTTNTEASGPDGNFGNGGAERRNPNSVRVRGLANPDRTRSYFLTDIGFDTYNTTRVAIAKGPNAILFGLGSPAGIVNNGLKQAMFEDANMISARYGSWGAHREVLDVNRELIEDKLAVRLVGLNNQVKFKQKPSFSDEQRLYGALSYKASESTWIRANFEVGSIDASRPNTSSPTSNIPTWIADGLPTNASNVSANGFSSFGGNRAPQHIYDNPSATHPSIGFDPDPATSGPDGIRRRHWTAANREDQGTSGFSQGVLTDETGYIFDFRDKSLSGIDNQQRFSFDAVNVTIEQRLGENAGIELAFDDQLYFSESLDRVTNTIRVDTGELLPYRLFNADGTGTDPTNPNVGRPYATMVENFRGQENERKAWRATGYYELDFADQSDDFSWLGRHVFTGVMSSQSAEILRYNNSRGSTISGEAEGVLENNRSRDYTTASWDLRTQGKRYLGGAITGIPSSGHLADRVLTGYTPRLNEFDAWMYDKGATPIVDGHTGAYRQVNATVHVDPITAGSLDRQEIDSLAVTGQSYFFNNNVVATYGWRKDDAYSYRDGSPTKTANDIAVLESLALPKVADSEVGESVFSYGVVGHLPKSLTENLGLELSAHYASSENFVPSPGRVTILNQPHPSPAGETTEYGFSVGALENKLFFRVNWYETISFNQTDGALGSASIPNWERLFYNNVRSSLQEKEPRDSTVPQAEYETWAADDPRLWPNNILWPESYTLPPLGMRQLFWTPVDPDPSVGGTNQVADSPNPNVTGVSDFQSEGMEIEGVWNPSENWTFSFNAAKQEVIKTNVLKSYLEYFTIREPQWVAMGHLVARPNTYQNATVQDIYQRTRTVQWPRLIKNIESEGRISPEIRKWRYNIITNYRFDDDSALKGWSVGGAYRWQDEVAIGYRNGTVDPSAKYGVDGLTASNVVDVTSPIFGPSEENLDIWLAHRRMILNDSVDWKIQLNIRNILDNDDLIYTSVDSDGVPTRVRIMNPMNFRLTSTFRF